MQAVLATGEITNSQELCELYNISPLPESSVELLACLYEKVFTRTLGNTTCLRSL